MRMSLPFIHFEERSVLSMCRGLGVVEDESTVHFLELGKWGVASL